MKRSCSLLRKIAVAGLSLAMLLSSSCISSKSIDEYGYATVIGIDSGKTKAFFVSMLLQRGNGAEEGAESDLCTHVGVESEDLFEAVGLIESSLPFSLNLSRTAAIVFGEDIALNGGVEQLLSASLGMLNIRYYANLVSVRGRAEDFLGGIQSELNPNVAKLQYSFVDYSRRTGLIPSFTLSEFFESTFAHSSDILLPLGEFNPEIKKDSASENGAKDGGRNNSSAETEKEQSEKGEKEKSSQPLQKAADILGSTEYMPGQIKRLGGLQASMLGSGLFHKHRLIGYLNGLHTQVVLIVKGQFEKGRIQLPLPNGRIISVRLSAQSQPKIRLILGETPKATFEIALYANVEHPEIREYSNSDMEILISEFLKKRAEEVFLACQALGSDVFELRNTAVKLFRRTSDWEAFNWEAAFKEVAVAFEIAVYLDYNPSKSSVE
ncbi:MAG: hypothetical protein BWY62_00972 [Firmicutes bacterium ADurb.Bin356]|nr:MAG: hypothetical protein BWY62_00972 [Firmicutes bacterium ADurb.Bin356]